MKVGSSGCSSRRGAAVWGALALTAREHGETMDAAARVAGVSDLLVGALVGGWLAARERRRTT